MTVSTSINSVQYDTNGTTGPWTVPYRFLENEHLSVLYTTAAGVEYALSLTTDYSVTGAGDASGTVTTVTAYAAGGTLAIIRNVPATQETDYVETDPFPAETHERALDKLTMLVQQSSYALNSALRVPETGRVLPTFPVVASRALKLAAFDSAGDPTVVAAGSGSGTDLTVLLSDPADPANGAGMVGFGASVEYAAETVGGAIQDMYGTRAFNLYVSLTGDDTLNDGLTSLTPFATLQKAFDTLMAIGNVGGQRTINIAAGTYDTADNRTARLGPANEDEADPDIDTYASDGVNSVNWIVVQGPDVGYDPATTPRPTPTAIFDAGGVAAFGLQFEGPVKVLVKNLKFLSATGYGVSGDGSQLRCENVHTDGCNIGISSVRGNLEVRGGWIYGNAGKTLTGIRSLFVNRHSIGYQGALGAGQGPFITFCSSGILAQESATGHADSVSFEDCVDAIRVTVNSRVNYSYSDFKRCNRAIRCDANSVVFGYTTAEFNDGTADANNEKIVLQQGGRDIDRDAYSNAGIATDYLTASKTVTASTGVNIILQKTLDAGLFAPVLFSIRKPQHIRIYAGGTATANADNAKTKNFNIRLGSTVLASVSVGGHANGAWILNGSIMFTAYNAQIAGLQFNITLSGASGRTVYCDTDAGTEDMRASSPNLKLEVQLDDGADTVVVEYAHFEVWG